MATRLTTTLLLVILTAAAGAQGALAELGFTETAARTFLLNEIKGPSLDRQSAIAAAGIAALLKIPPARRAAVVTALFAWARAYTRSTAFTAAYAQPRKDAGADVPNTVTIEEEVQIRIVATLSELESQKKEAAGLPPDMAKKMLAAIKQIEDNARSPAMANAHRMAIEAERASQGQRDAELALKLPANPEALFARRLREFLDATREVNFAARTMSLNGGADGIVFLDRDDRKRNWMWQIAVIAGPEATAAARTAAAGWVKESQ